MAKGLLASAFSFARNLRAHARRLVRREESAREALDGLARDSKKLKRKIAGPSHKHGEDAKELLKHGKTAYNRGQYEDAEELFRNAIVADRGYARAYTYLGHTLYKQGRGKEAVNYWKKAIEIAPDSEAAENARRKIAMFEQQTGRMRNWIDEHR